MDKTLDRIYDVINKNNEDIICQLIVKNYDKSNFFVALVFNKSIEKFKVLYVPIDAIKKDNLVHEYFCYQFVFMNIVNSMLKRISEFQENNIKSRYNNKISSDDDYYIEFSTFKPLREQCYKFKQYIDPEFSFFFDVVVMLFEHVPNVMNDLSRSILEQFNSRYELLKYNKVVSFRLRSDDLELIFDCGKFRYDAIRVQFLEKVGNNYYGVVNGNKILINSSQGMVRIYSGNVEPLGEEVYSLMMQIKEKKEKKFYRIEYVDNDESYYLFCYGYDFSQNEFLVHNNLRDHNITLKDVSNKKVKIHDMDKKLVDQICALIRDKYIESKADDIIKYTFGDE